MFGCTMYRSLREAEACCSPDMRSWALEINIQKTRRFFNASSTTVSNVVQRSWRCPVSVYELVNTLGGKLGMRMYCDLEFDKALNSTTTVAEADIVGEVVRCVDKWLHMYCSPDGLQVDVSKLVVLTASSDAKFSMHLILPLLGGALFSSVKHLKLMANYIAAESDKGILLVNNKQNEMKSMLDLSVYKENQQFRLMGCVKFGDSRALRGQQKYALQDTLICVDAARKTLIGVTAQEPTDSGCDRTARQHVGGGGSAARSANELCPSLSQFVSNELGGCRMYGVKWHKKYGEGSSSLYLYTSSKECCTKVHSSNTVTVEVCLQRLAWRVLCQSPNCRSRGCWKGLNMAVVEQDQLAHWDNTLRDWAIKWLEQPVGSEGGQATVQQ